MAGKNRAAEENARREKTRELPRQADVPITDIDGRTTSRAAAAVMEDSAVPDGAIPMTEQMVASGL